MEPLKKWKRLFVEQVHDGRNENLIFAEVTLEMYFIYLSRFVVLNIDSRIQWRGSHWR